MGSFWEKVKEFFAEDMSYLQQPPIEFEGKVYKPYDPKEDQYAVWPNATCPLCRGLNLKRDLFYNKETETFIHKACLLNPPQPKKK